MHTSFVSRWWVFPGEGERPLSQRCSRLVRDRCLAGFCCSTVKRHCYEPCDEGREAATKPVNVELDSAQATQWSGLNGTRMEYWDFTDGAVLDDVEPRNECSGPELLELYCWSFRASAPLFRAMFGLGWTRCV